ncbi:hypothetical protein [Sandaracinus amylolyticus]|uniref:Uncharacterized protein n=1 Tax=Sandaracinus amylolyticus TaxID=927083 RepID=A0A0F6YGU6_9BACT|nr:hypothetical protein [Sandaracinus amylolyticus]AKF04072.1 hypothetical protein DB32_001221 [Sandaracinus amylolyticus]
MTMRAVIAMPTAADPLPRADAAPEGLLGKLFGIRPRPRFQGVYLHDGGHPSEIGPLLFNVARLRGVERAWSELLTGNPAGWSSLAFFYDRDRCRAWDGHTKIGVAQHQENFSADREDPGPVSYQGDPQRDLGFRTPPITEVTDKMGAVTVWVLCRSELVLFAVDDDGVGLREIGRHPWEREPSWDEVDAALDQALDG